jgi:SAM-dependent methyltransferase
MGQTCRADYAKIPAMTPYSQPLYYEIAFSFFDVKKQCDLIEKFIRNFSAIPVSRCLDIACGPSLQLREFARRGYRCIGLDKSRVMLDYLGRTAETEGVKIEIAKADMCNFSVEKIGGRKADFAFMMMGSISLIESNERMLSHLESVARCLKKGGLYLIENAEADWATAKLFGSQTWTMKRDGITVDTTYTLLLKDTLKQTAVASIILDVNDNGREFYFEESRGVKIFFPQEFIALIDRTGKFDFVGWFEPDSMKKLGKAKENNLVILKRR